MSDDPIEEFEMTEEEWEAAEVESEGDDEAEVSEDLDDGNNPRENSNRVSQDIAARVPTWKGVRSCSDESRAISAMTPHYDKWVAATIAAYPDLTPLAKGYSGRREWKNKTSSTGKRSCKGWWKTLTVYVDFAPGA